MNVYTAAEIRELDHLAVHEHGMPEAVLMESAGASVARTVLAVYGTRINALIFCGPGNNGGDGFVAARRLAIAGVHVHAVMCGAEEKLSEAARIHFRCVPASAWRTLDTIGDKLPAQRQTVVVDALLGTGSRGAPRGVVLEAVDVIGRLGLPTLSVDLPTGVHADTGEIAGRAVAASHTVTFTGLKPGHLLFPGAANAGTIHVSSLGMDWQAIGPAPGARVYAPCCQTRIIRLSPSPPDRQARGPLQPRAAESNKGDYGHVGVLAGSRGMAGAPALVARAAQRVGAGLVTVLCPASAQPMVAAKLDEQMTVPLDDKDGSVAPKAYEAVRLFGGRADCFCIGPGMTTSPGATEVVTRALNELICPVVLDADGLNILAANPQLLAHRPTGSPLVLTPHPGEAARLLGTSTGAIQSNRMAAARDLAARFNATIVLKGRYSIVASAEGKLIFNVTGNPGMASGGMGDTLTGILGGLFAQWAAARSSHDPAVMARGSCAPEELVALGVFLHGHAGDLASADHGEAGLTAGDLIACLPRAIQSIEVDW